MVQTIRSEVQKNVSSVLDLDSLRYRYKQEDLSIGYSVLYPGYQISSIDDNIFSLLVNASKEKFKTRWAMRPDYVSYDFYSSVVYWPFILIVNMKDSFEDFIGMDEIFVPRIRDILQVAKTRNVGLSFVTDVNFSSDVDQNTTYYKRFPFDEIEVNRVRSENDLLDSVLSSVETTSECVLKEVNEVFTLTSTDISNKYIELNNIPFNENSIVITINPFITPQSYGYDYSLKTGTQSLRNRISWSDSDVDFGDGMENLLEVGNILNVRYLFNEIDCNVCEPEEYDIIDGGTF